MLYYTSHLALAFGWAMFLLTFIKTMQFKDNKESKIFGLLSFIFMLLVMMVGVKIMLSNHSIIKSGYWIHLKLSIDILLMLETLFLLNLLRVGKFISTKCGNIMYISTFIGFILMIFLTMLRPF
jgi:hypothetical protein